MPLNTSNLFQISAMKRRHLFSLPKKYNYINRLFQIEEINSQVESIQNNTWINVKRCVCMFSSGQWVKIGGRHIFNRFFFFFKNKSKWTPKKYTKYNNIFISGVKSCNALLLQCYLSPCFL